MESKSPPINFFTDLPKLLGKGLLLLIIGIISGFSFSYLYTSKIMVKKFESSGVIYIDKNPGPLPSILNEVIYSENVLLLAIGNLEDDVTTPSVFNPDIIRKTLSVDYTNNYSPYVTISFSSENPTLSIKLTNAIIDATIQKGNSNPAFSPDSLSVDKYAENALHIGLPDSLIWSLSSLFGFIFSSLLVFIIYLIRGRVELISSIQIINLKYFKFSKNSRTIDVATIPSLINSYELAFSNITKINVVGIIPLASNDQSIDLIDKLSSYYSSKGFKTLIADLNFAAPENQFFSIDTSKKHLDQSMNLGEAPIYSLVSENLFKLSTRKVDFYGKLLKDEKLSLLFQSFREDFDYVIVKMFDGPNITENLTISNWVDLSILNIHYGETKFKMLNKYVNSAKQSNNLFGVITQKTPSYIDYFFRKK